MPLDPLDYKFPSTKQRTWLDEVWDRPDIIAAIVIIAANACLWWFGVKQRALPFVLFLWTVPLNGH